MKNLDKYLTLLEGEVDGLLLTSRYSRHYGAEYDIAEGVAIVTKKGCRYFTDNRYTEAAENGIKGFEVLDVAKGGGYAKCLNTAIADFGVTCLGYEEPYLTVAEFMMYEKNLNAKLVPYNKEINGFRGVKEEWELAIMRKAQDITDKAFAEVITRIQPGMTELELQAELIYCLYKNGATGLAFDPIVVSGPKTSLPQWRCLRAGDPEGRFRDHGLWCPVPGLLRRHDPYRGGGLYHRGDGEGLQHRAGSPACGPGSLQGWRPRCGHRWRSPEGHQRCRIRRILRPWLRSQPGPGDS